ncbi:hypothetical protein [Halomonas sp. G11]|uniref:hypothetical protein n=1 Tax=Halomonas sp. G11 TaxID=1684425 RepID=UPI000B0742BF|nr:hypothetical protein [Halomonas sp. G11]
MNFEIGVLQPNSPHLFADLIEFLAIFDPHGKNEVHKNDIANIVNGLPLSDDDVDSEELLDDSDLSDSGKHDIKEERLEDAWTQLEYRASCFSENYPFQVVGDVIKLNTDWSNPRHKVYRFLLASSRLRSFKPTNRYHWSQAFAKVSSVALSSLLPDYADVKIFDANSDDRREYYGTDCRDALVRLGDQVSAFKVHEEDIRERDSSGDGGIDLVGVISFRDMAHGAHVIFGQCGAQEENWPDKRLEAHPMGLSNYFQFSHDVITTMFTPVLYRSSTGRWAQGSKVTGVVVIDRLRIISLIEKSNDFEGIALQAYFQNFEAEFEAYSLPL